MSARAQTTEQFAAAGLHYAALYTWAHAHQQLSLPGACNDAHISSFSVHHSALQEPAELPHALPQVCEESLQNLIAAPNWQKGRETVYHCAHSRKQDSISNAVGSLHSSDWICRTFLQHAQTAHCCLKALCPERAHKHHVSACRLSMKQTGYSGRPLMTGCRS